MGRRPQTGETAAWDELYELAADQAGYFAAAQARELGFSTARLQYHVNTGKLLRPRRGIFRLSQFPSSPLEEYVVHWLWSGRQGVFSHETALMLHELSDALPARVYMTLPSSWSTRRLRIPSELRVHFADVSDKDRTWRENIPLTSVQRTIEDCVRDGVTPELVEKALEQAVERGLINRRVARRIEASP